MGLDFERIKDEDAAIEKKVFSALSELNKDKALGLDGFSIAFWQFSWEFMKEEVIGFFKEFLD